ncbi:DUF916 and DUF3324 domain-containing protein [Brochothrix campestris]|uniref:DUF916 and DUF3324 domain-containing protein n=1 Tax=Brochothrix campestris TaxID=2757 RepID=UPI0038D20E59
MNIKKQMGMVISLLIVLGSGLQPVAASEFNFAVEPQKPSNQIDQKKGYFDLKVTPGQTQQLTIMLKNATNKAVTIQPKIAATTTSSSGVVEYGPSKKKNDETLLYDMKDLVTTEKKITIKADSSYALKLDVKAPKKAFKGSVTGGITLEEDVDETARKTEGNGMAIDNRYAYVVGIQMRQDIKAVAPKLHLHDVEAAQRNYRNVINATIQNSEPTYVNQLKIDAKITKKGKSEVLYESKKEMMQMAPNSNFAYPIALGDGKTLEPGNYTLNMTAQSYDNKWKWSKDFTITDDEATALNEKDVTVVKSYTTYYIIGGLIILLLIGLIIWLILRKKNIKETTGGIDNE